jgi:hypothetical protein
MIHGAFNTGALIANISRAKPSGPNYVELLPLKRRTTNASLQKLNSLQSVLRNIKYLCQGLFENVYFEYFSHILHVCLYKDGLHNDTSTAYLIKNTATYIIFSITAR